MEEADETESEDESSEDEFFEFNHKDFEQPIYEGSTVTVAESFIMILTFVFRHKIANTCLADLLQLIRIHCALTNKCITSLFKFKKIMKAFHNPLQRIYFCSHCTQLLKDEKSKCSNANTTCKKAKTKFFIKNPIIPQLKRLFQRPSFVNNLNYKYTRKKININNFEDFYDGKIYKELEAQGFFVNPYNITFTWNTDGVRVFKSSGYNVWPFYLIINELPPHLRYKKENMMLVGLWFGHEAPKPNLFTTSILEELTTIVAGIKVKILNTFEVIKGLVICGTCDWPAKAKFLNMTGHSGFFGCPKCYTKGKKLNKNLVYSKKVKRLRSTATTKRLAAFATPDKKVKGIKGPSSLFNYVYDAIRTTVVDDLHCVYLGVVKTFITLWLSPKYSDQSWSLIKMTQVINDRLQKVKPPSFVKRYPRNLTDHKFWKGQEFKTWLLAYCFPILIDLLESDYLNHFKLFILAIYLLNQESISAGDLEKAKQLINKFVFDFPKLYPEQKLVPNLHKLLHLTENVENFGSVRFVSCFFFEDLNGQLRNLVHGTNHANLQIVSNVAAFIGFESIKDKFLKKDSLAEIFCDGITKINMRRNLTLIKDRVFILGNCKVLDVPDLLSDILSHYEIRVLRYIFFSDYLKIM